MRHGREVQIDAGNDSEPLPIGRDTNAPVANVVFPDSDCRNWLIER